MAAWEAARKYAATTAAKIEQLERDIEARFLADLGLKAPAQATLPKVFAVWWKLGTLVGHVQSACERCYRHSRGTPSMVVGTTSLKIVQVACTIGGWFCCLVVVLLQL